MWGGYCFTVSEWGFMCGCWFQGLVWTALPGTVLPLDRPSPGPPFPWTTQNFALFFSLSRRKIRSFLPSLGVFSLNFGGVFEDRDAQMCTFGLSGCRVKQRRLRGRRGFTRQPENSKRAHLRAPALQTPPKFKMWKDDYDCFLSQLCARMSVSPTNETTRRGNRVLHSRLPVSLRHCPSLPSATACGHRQWDWALPHSSRKQQTHFTWMYIMQEKQKASWANRVFYAPPGADRHSISNTPPQRLRSSGRCHRHAACRRR